MYCAKRMTVDVAMPTELGCMAVMSRLCCALQLATTYEQGGLCAVQGPGLGVKKWLTCSLLGGAGGAAEPVAGI